MPAYQKGRPARRTFERGRVETPMPETSESYTAEGIKKIKNRAGPPLLNQLYPELPVRWEPAQAWEPLEPGRS